MWNRAQDLVSKKKNLLLIFLIVALIGLLFVRGLELHLGKSINDRVRFHAIPIAISVLYHHHPHDYTGLAALAYPFQGPGNVQSLINTAKIQNVVDGKLYYWVADDRGFTDYVIAAFLYFRSACH